MKLFYDILIWLVIRIYDGLGKPLALPRDEDL